MSRDRRKDVAPVEGPADRLLEVCFVFEGANGPDLLFGQCPGEHAVVWPYEDSLGRLHCDGLPAAADAGDPAVVPTVGVGELARIALRRLRLLPLCLAIAGAIALAYVALTPPRYGATMSILVDAR